MAAKLLCKYAIYQQIIDESPPVWFYDPRLTKAAGLNLEMHSSGQQIEIVSE